MQPLLWCLMLGAPMPVCAMSSLPAIDFGRFTCCVQVALIY